jgi:hypothetical protein
MVTPPGCRSAQAGVPMLLKVNPEGATSVHGQRLVQNAGIESQLEKSLTTGRYGRPCHVCDCSPVTLEICRTDFCETGPEILQVCIFSTPHRNTKRVDCDELLPDVVIIADEVDAQLKQQVLCFMDDVPGEQLL